jgi:hypothetical protein
MKAKEGLIAAYNFANEKDYAQAAAQQKTMLA